MCDRGVDGAACLKSTHFFFSLAESFEWFTFRAFLAPRFRAAPAVLGMMFLEAISISWL
jgi:hypothetical protein